MLNIRRKLSALSGSLPGHITRQMLASVGPIRDVCVRAHMCEYMHACVRAHLCVALPCARACDACVCMCVWLPVRAVPSAIREGRPVWKPKVMQGSKRPQKNVTVFLCLSGVSKYRQSLFVRTQGRRDSEFKHTFPLFSSVNQCLQHIRFLCTDVFTSALSWSSDKVGK